MSITYLLDTNVVSEPLRPQPDEHLLQRLRQHQGEMAIAAVVWHELQFGAERLSPSRKRAAIEQYLTDVVAATLPVLPYDARAASWHAVERARLAAAGRMPAFADGQIAAIAAVNELTVVTVNVGDFEGFGVAVENWIGV
jgi:tRNA(fMet)-specific endonuclease VapC